MSVTFLSLILVIVIFLNYYPSIVSRDFIISAKKENMMSSAYAVAGVISNIDSEFIVYNSDFFGFLDSSQFDRIFVTNANARVVYDNATMGNLIGKTVLFNEVFLALNNKETFRYTFNKNEIEFIAAVPIYSKDTIKGTVYVYSLNRDDAMMLLNIQRYILIFSILLSVLVLIFAVFLSRLLTGQIDVLRSGVRKMKEGELGVVIPVKTDDELGELAGAFNDFSKKLSRTEIRRREFVSDASHELKTPLASIKLLVESMQIAEDMPEELRKEFLKDIENEIGRLVRITERLFTLTKMDNETEQKKVRLDVSKVTKDAVWLLKSLAKQRGITIDAKIEDGLFVYGPPDSYSQIVYNLLDNAVKYNKDNGKVSVELKTHNEQALLIIADSGVGIADEDKEQVFERFYRVDKARSRDTGGTGLGLSIVKGNVEGLGGTINFESSKGEGTTFFVYLPRIKE